MKTNMLEKVGSNFTKVKHPDFKVGDVIEVHETIKEDEKDRIQVFVGVVIAIKNSGVSKTFTVRKISYGVGVEKIYPLYSPLIEKIKIIKRAEKVKKSKLYFLRKKVGKRALKAGNQVPAEGEDLETKFEEEMTQEDESEEPEADERADKEVDDQADTDNKSEKDVTKEKDKEGDSETDKE